MQIKEMLMALNADEYSVNIIANYLGYAVGKNPNDPQSEWRMLFTGKIPNKSRAIIALKNVPELDNETKTMDIRKLYKQVEQLQVSFGGSFDAEIAGFIGKQRIVLFRVKNGNRDERLDLNIETTDKPLYQDNFHMMKNEAISVTVDDFWGDYIIDGLKDVFKRELTNHFLQMVAFYRKKLSELITARHYKNELSKLVSQKAQFYIKTDNLTQLVEEESFISVLSSVVDTMILRQLMRRFLEGYYGKDNVDPFEISNIALGVGSGTLDSAIQEAVTVYSQIADETAIKKLNKKKNIIQTDQLSLFDEEEYAATSKIEMKEDSKQKLIELYNKATKQFQSVYGGDLFASSIGNVTTSIENLLVEHDPEFWVKFWVDTSSEKYSFRFEDVPPEALEKQYENSMSQNVQIKIEDGKPVVFYGEDLQEQKNKGAYYTDEKFVQYMVSQTVEVEFQKRIAEVKKAIITGDENQVMKNIDYLLDMKTADLTAGGGSFLRGAFRQLAEKHDALVGLKVTETIREKYPMLQAGDKGILAWEEYILHHMIYGVDIDYKAILISSLSLMLSSLQHRPRGEKLPKLIGRTLIHQNSLMNAVPFYRREEIYEPMADEIKKLLKLKQKNASNHIKENSKLQKQVIKYAQAHLQDETQFLHVEALELNLPEVFFNSDGTLKENGGFDCIIGNPPWEIWKPNSDEFFSQYANDYLAAKNKKAKDKIQENLFAKFPNLKGKWAELEQRIQLGSQYFRAEENYHFQSWMVEGKRTGGDINLFKVAVERLTQLTAKQGKLSLLVPDNIMTDLGSSGLRHMLFDDNHVLEFLSFENRQKIFASVDSRYKFAVLSYNKEIVTYESFKVFFYKQNLQDLYKEEEKYHYDLNFLRESNGEMLSLVQVRNKELFDILMKIGKSFTSGLLSKFKLIRDFDLTNDAHYFEDMREGLIPLYEGKLMEQFRLLGEPKLGVAEKIVGRKEKAYQNFRIGIRRIASSTNKRTLIATLMPRNITAANSLYLEKEDTDVDLITRIFYVGVMNSYIADFQLRQIVNSTVTFTLLNQIVIPRVKESSFANEIIDLTIALLLKNGSLYKELEGYLKNKELLTKDFDTLIAELNARVTLDFNLTRTELIHILKTFESVNHKKFVQEEAQRIIEAYDRLKEGEN